MKIIEQRRIVEVKEHVVDFDDKRRNDGSGFTFPLDVHGDPIFSTDCAKRNYEMCVAHPDIYEKNYRVHKWKYIEPAKGKCICGRVVELYDQYLGACQCECGRWYNLFGDALIDPKYWEED